MCLYNEHGANIRRKTETSKYLHKIFSFLNKDIEIFVVGGGFDGEQVEDGMEDVVLFEHGG